MACLKQNHAYETRFCTKFTLALFLFSQDKTILVYLISTKPSFLCKQRKKLGFFRRKPSFFVVQKSNKKALVALNLSLAILPQNTNQFLCFLRGPRNNFLRLSLCPMNQGTIRPACPEWTELLDFPVI